MSYSRLTYVTGGPPARSAANLNHAEAGIQDASDRLGVLEPRVDALEAFGWFNVQNYGATGENATADTAGFKAAVAAALATPGSTLYIPPPPNDGSYMLNDTIKLYDPLSSNNQITMNIVADLSWHGIMWVGAGNKAVFESRGFKDSIVDGLHVTVGASVTGVVIWEMNVGVFGSVNYTTTGRVQFNNCLFSTNSGGASIIGWRMSHGSNTADVSMVAWNNCNVQGDMGTSLGSRTSTGWVWEGSNVLNLSWFESSAAFCSRGWSTIPTSGAAGTHGGDCVFWFACGGSYCDIDFELKTTGNYGIFGGRWEEGRQFLSCPQTNYAGHLTMTINSMKLETYQPPAGRLIEIGAATTLLIKGGSLRLLSVAADTDMIYASTATGAFGYIGLEGVGLPGDAPSGGSTTTGPTWVGGVTTGTGTWKVKMTGCVRTNSSNEVTSMIDY